MPASPLPSRPYKGSQPTHQTSNLPGYPAVDIMGKNGDLVVATEDGYVYRLGSAQGGQAFYMHGVSGADYWYGHLGGYASKLKSVTSSNPVRVRQGEVVGFLGGHPTPHLHFGVHGANAAIIASTPQAAGSTATLSDLPKSRAGFFWPDWAPDPRKGEITPDIPYLPQFPQDVPGLGSAGKKLSDSVLGVIPGIDWPSKNWDRLLMVPAGFILMLVGLILLGGRLGIVPSKMAGPLAVLQYGPTVQRASSANLRPKVVHNVSTEPRRPSSGYEPSTSEIPF